jgi:hypothetical protein
MQKDNLKPWHPGMYYAGQTTEWMPTDTKESFDRLVQDPVHYKYFQAQGWLEPGAITYQINKEGFRCEEFVKDDPCMVVLGCSYTVGIGLPVKDLWATKVGAALGLKVYNLAWGGTGTDTCFRLARYWIPRLKPQVVCMLAPPRSRIELITINGTSLPVEVFMPMSSSCLFVKNDIFLKHWFGNEENQYINQEKNMLAIESIARSNNAKYASVQADSETGCSRDMVGYARDYMHTGPAGHDMIADKLLAMLS